MRGMVRVVFDGGGSVAYLADRHSVSIQNVLMVWRDGELVGRYEPGEWQSVTQYPFG